MKTNIFKLTYLVTLSLGLLTSCVKDDDYTTPQLTECTETSLVKNREVSEILAGPIVAQHQDIVPGTSDVIEAYVTSSDIAGNFFKSISFQTLDGSKAFSVPVDATSTFINYEPGRKVLIKMDDLYTDVKDGGMRIGGLYGNSSGGAEVGRLPEPQFKTSVQRSCTVVNEDDLVQHITVAQAIASNDYINKLIEFDKVQFDDAAITSTYYNKNNDLGGATNYNLVQIGGGSITFRTSSFANFAAKAVATGNGKVRGVLTKFGTTFQFMVRTESDIQLTNPRIIPLFEESFANNFPLWTKFSVTGAQVWASTAFGNPAPSALMNGFSGSAQNNEDWLISPAIDFTGKTSALFSFESSTRFAGPALTVWVSTNYTSGAPSTATWTQITTANFPVWTSGSFTPFIASGGVDLTSYVGNSNFRIAFKYTSTTAGAASWEVDNVKVYGN